MKKVSLSVFYAFLFGREFLVQLQKKVMRTFERVGLVFEIKEVL